MKKLLFIYVVFFSSQLFAQTAEETVEYINSKLLLQHSDSRGEVNNEGIIRIMNTSPFDPRDITLGNWSQIKSITYLVNEKGRWVITISVPAIIYESWFKKSDYIFREKDFQKTSTDNSIVIWFGEKIPEDEIKKLTKALKHMAALKGAKLVKEDLF